MKATLSKRNPDEIVVSFRYNPEIVSKVRSIPGRRYDPNRKCWHVPIAFYQRVEEIGFSFDPELRKRVAEFQKPDNVAELADAKIYEEIDALGLPLRPYQREGVAFIDRCGGRLLLGDEMGLGKTLQVIAWLRLRHSDPDAPILILCPTHLQDNWMAEIRKWWPEMAHQTAVVRSTKYPIESYVFDATFSGFGASILIVGFGTLSARRTNIDTLPSGETWSCVVIDECHYIKNVKSKRAQATKKLCSGAQSLIQISGTPIMSRPIEFYNSLNLVRPDLFRSWWYYAKRYCAMKYNGFGWDSTGASNVEELHDLIKPFFLRRKKVDVLSDLPEKQRSVVFVDYDLHAYLRRQRELLRECVPAIEFVGEMKRHVADLKVPGVVSWIADFLNSTDRKLLVFSIHHRVTDAIATGLRDDEEIDCVLVADGRTQDKQQVVDRFQSDPSMRVLLAGLDAMNTGVTLTAASDVVFTEVGWTPAQHDQAEDRVHRIGQEADSVNIWYLIGAGSIEEDILQMLDEKRHVFSRVIDGREPSPEDRVLIDESKSQFAERIMNRIKEEV